MTPLSRNKLPVLLSVRASAFSCLQMRFEEKRQFLGVHWFSSWVAQRETQVSLVPARTVSYLVTALNSLFVAILENVNWVSNWLLT